MEKNLPFVSIPLADKGYNNYIIPFIGNLDDGNIFKNIITVLLHLVGISLLLGGWYLAVAGVFGGDGFFKTTIIDGAGTGKTIGAVIGLLIGFSVSLLTAWVLYSIAKKRTEQLCDQTYQGLLDFVFNKTFPKLIIIAGEILFVLLLYAGILQIVASLVSSFVYAPLVAYPALILNVLPGMKVFARLLPEQVYGDYDAFGTFVNMGILGTAAAFVVLIAFYLYKEVYTYLLKLVTVFINFLPKFAFPLAIRKSYLDARSEPFATVLPAPDFCRQCGKKAENPDDTFCMHCGNKYHVGPAVVLN